MVREQGKLFGLTKAQYCTFCKIVRREEPSYTIYEDEFTFVFLDTKPLFPGHCLVIPKSHILTLEKLPIDQIKPLFTTVKMISKAVQLSLRSEGTFVANNNVVSQSVPHLHIHIVPRNKGDGLRGFFWPRNPYKGKTHIESIQNKLITTINQLQN